MSPRETTPRRSENSAIDSPFVGWRRYRSRGHRLGVWLVASAACILLCIPKGYGAGDRLSASPLPTPPPPPPYAPSPVAQFRKLLAMNPTELSQALAERPDSQRRVLEAKVEEYRSLPDDKRELRLLATELRYYLRPLLALAPSNRLERLAQVPDELRSMIDARLAQWDVLAAETRAEVLRSDWMISYILGTSLASNPNRTTPSPALSPTTRDRLNQELARWRSLSPDRRRQAYEHFRRFFELTPGERSKTLGTLSQDERRRVESTLEALDRLPGAQRQACLEAFSRLASLSREEQIQFLRNADRWKELSPTDRDTWRRIVTRLPPLPPGLNAPLLPPPPTQRRLPVVTSSPPSPPGALTSDRR